MRWPAKPSWVLSSRSPRCLTRRTRLNQSQTATPIRTLMCQRASEGKTRILQASEIEKRSPGAAGKIEGQLFSAFKLWDRNKDDAVVKEELEKALAPNVVANKPPVAADPKAAVAVLYDKLDADKDGKVDQKEFGDWATPFAAHLVKFAQLQERRAGIERELVNTQRLLSRSGNVTAAEGFVASELNDGIITYQQMLNEFDTELNELATDGGHAEYRDLLVQKLFR